MAQGKGGILNIDGADLEMMVSSMGRFQSGNTEAIINDVFHNFAGDRAQEEIIRLMPVSRKKKGTHAKFSKSLRNVNGNLSVTVATAGKYGYLYFPDDGTNTRRHIGNQRFFERGGEAVQEEIINRCITKLIENFDKGE